MNSDIVFYSTTFIGHLVAFSLALVIFSTTFFQRKKRSYWILSAIIVFNLYTLIIGFEFSALMGIGFLIIDFCIAVVTYGAMRMKVAKARQRKRERTANKARSSKRSL
ncbi:hypothetical protein [Halobacillus ihumii]|uniref:hypothetical protein n=1 Tax=Halobacillus ihumii TaxID=2686092 RepID=UPI0013D10538|nr:hypothetical protein [Halobacillus ihumii]